MGQKCLGMICVVVCLICWQVDRRRDLNENEEEETRRKLFNTVCASLSSLLHCSRNSPKAAATAKTTLGIHPIHNTMMLLLQQQQLHGCSRVGLQPSRRTQNPAAAAAAVRFHGGVAVTLPPQQQQQQSSKARRPPMHCRSVTTAGERLKQQLLADPPSPPPLLPTADTLARLLD